MKEAIKMLANYLYQDSRMALANGIEALITANKILTPFLVFRALPAAEAENPAGNLTFAAGLVAAGVTLNTALPVVRNILVSRVRHDVQKKMTVDMVDTIYKGEQDDLLGKPTGEVAVLTSKNYGTVAEVAPSFFSRVVPPIAETIGISGILSYLYGEVGAAPLIVLASYLLAAQKMGQSSEAITVMNSTLKRSGFGALLNAVNSYKIAHQFGRTGYELSKLQGELEKLQHSYDAVDDKAERDALLLSFINLIGIVGTGVYFYLRHANGNMTTTDFGLFAYYMYRLGSVLDSLPQSITTLYTGLIDTKLLKDFLHRAQVDEIAVPKSLKLNAAPKIEFDGVTFKHKPNQVGHLSKVSFSAAPGQKIAIMGETGSGKSTLLKLLQRFHKFEGQIKIDEQDITETTLDSLRATLAVVEQESLVVEGSMFGNIKYADLDATEKDVMKAAFFAKLNFSKDRLLEPAQMGGANYSGGEKQRAAIARALLKPGARVFLLDEPTSALDQETSRDVMKIIDQLTGQSTVLIVTHDPIVAVNADKIVYLDKGEIVEMGNYETLMQQRGKLYAQVASHCARLGVKVEDIKPLTANELTTNDKAQQAEFAEWRQLRLN